MLLMMPKFETKRYIVTRAFESFDFGAAKLIIILYQKMLEKQILPLL
jgi:hypothetical protein